MVGLQCTLCDKVLAPCNPSRLANQNFVLGGEGGRAASIRRSLLFHDLSFFPFTKGPLVLRPRAHAFKIVQARSIHLQAITILGFSGEKQVSRVVSGVPLGGLGREFSEILKTYYRIRIYSIYGEMAIHEKLASLFGNVILSGREFYSGIGGQQ